MRAKLQELLIGKGRRVLAISDIHGNLSGLQRLLEKVKFNEKDILFIVGDIVEKGPNSLKTLRYIMELQKKYEVYAVCGNCDDTARKLDQRENHSRLLTYLLWREKSLLNEMCKEISITLTKDSDIEETCKSIKQHFKAEIEWLAELPDIIETENFIFVHGGLVSENLTEQDAELVKKQKSFLESELSFHKYVIVGHWPVALYAKGKPDCSPIVNRERKIISIDGGNVLKRDGQLNVFIIPDISSEEFTHTSTDDFPAGVVHKDQEESKSCFTIPWIDNQIEVLKEEEEFSECRHITSGYTMWVPGKYIFKDKEGLTRCEDTTDYRIGVRQGEQVRIVETFKDRYLVKKDGVTGWYYGGIERVQKRIL
ncbi:serine/threonine protein phosphatase [Anaerocolumna cellulosilytica]|uniref:Serine/threonine protein phosphatase n=1 Tax=Anaerocolumna cellulosilytica TaxID=433286 RepID=A0A6S6QXD7_9FIRM|nr:metallophosphoesterase [Anaerocolumna cellulosilytica]MBB5195993.1 protein phosphatase [Anaerocolumna cellulosilytica]BCJ93709.1 serine/threonine protein phosphatase [Anaerocolumna cellulosilytica]